MPQPREFKNQTLEYLKKYYYAKDSIENVMNTMPESEYLDNEERHKIKSSLKCGLIFLFLYVTMLLII